MAEGEGWQYGWVDESGFTEVIYGAPTGQDMIDAGLAAASKLNGVSPHHNDMSDQMAYDNAVWRWETMSPGEQQAVLARMDQANRNIATYEAAARGDNETHLTTAADGGFVVSDSSGRILLQTQRDVETGVVSLAPNSVTTLPTVTVTDSRPGLLSRVWNALTGWHFEGRTARNGTPPTYDQARAQGSGWQLLGPAQSIYHDNGVGQPELKYIHPSGREVVFNGDTLQPITDPRYAGTYNYVNPAPAPENWYNVGGWLSFAGRGVGHLVTDVVPYWMGGNVRGNDPPPEPSKPPGT